MRIFKHKFVRPYDDTEYSEVQSHYTTSLDGTHVDYDTVLDYLVGLSDEDFKRLKDVAGIYRDANHKASAALGVANEPTTHIQAPVELPSNTEASDTTIDFTEDDDKVFDFLEDEPKKTARSEDKK